LQAQGIARYARKAIGDASAGKGFSSSAPEAAKRTALFHADAVRSVSFEKTGEIECAAKKKTKNKQTTTTSVASPAYGLSSYLPHALSLWVSLYGVKKNS
jgi:aminoglycoside phosphotransferase family enzyme